jgi:WD40 repeat protein
MKPLLYFAVVAGFVLSADPARGQATRPQRTVLQEIDSERFPLPYRRNIHALAFSPDGKTLAVGEDDLHLYDVSGRPALRTHTLHTRIGFGIHALAFSPDGKRLALGGADHSVRIWAVDGDPKEKFHKNDHQGAVRSVCFSADGALLASGGDDQTVLLWDVAEDGSAKERAVIRAQDKFSDAVRGVFFSPKGKSLFVGCSNGSFRTFNVAAAQPRQTGGFKAKSGYGDMTIAAPADNRFWAITDHKTVHLVAGLSDVPLMGHTGNVRQVVVSADGKVLASAGEDGKLAVWSVVSRTIRVSKERPGHFACAACGQDSEGNYAIAGGMDSGDVILIRVAFQKK